VRPLRPCLALALAAALSSLACGKRGDPLPPLSHTPQPVRDMKMAQRGTNLEVTYTTPRATVGGRPLGLMEVELSRADGKSFSNPTRRRRKAAPGEVLTEVEPIPPPGTPVWYSIQVIGKGRSVRTGPQHLEAAVPPPVPSDLKAALVPGGVQLAWEGALPSPLPTPTPRPSPSPGASASPAPGTPGLAPAPAPSGALPPAGGRPAPSPRPSGAGGGRGRGGAPTPFGASPSPKASATPPPPLQPGFWVYRRAAPSGAYRNAFAMDPIQARTWDDKTAKPGESWCYVVRSVLADDPVIESASSNEACVSVADVAPPVPPRNLTVIPAPEAVDVSWSPGRETDLASYKIWRQAAGEEPVLAGTVAATQTSFRDPTPPALGTSYSVSAVDTAGNESARSSPAEVRP